MRHLPEAREGLNTNQGGAAPSIIKPTSYPKESPPEAGKKFAWTTAMMSTIVRTEESDGDD